MNKLILKLIALYQGKKWKKQDAIRDKGLSIPDDIEMFDNISYGPFGKDNLLCIYKPKAQTKILPCIVNFHGGGYFYGDKELYKYYCADLAQRGFAVLSFNYRLAPKYQYPSQLEDVSRVLSWLSENAEQYCLDKENIFVVGDSAGAQIASQFITIMTNKEYAKLFSFNSSYDFVIRAIALNSGFYDTCNLQDKTISFLMSGYAHKYFRNRSEQLDVISNITKDFPPCYIVSAPNDFVFQHATPMYDYLKSMGIECKCKIYGTKEDENAAHVFHLNIRLELAKQCNDDESEFFKEHIVSK